jgi:hypothetical protein
VIGAFDTGGVPNTNPYTQPAEASLYREIIGQNGAGFRSDSLFGPRLVLIAAEVKESILGLPLIYQVGFYPFHRRWEES